jgi:hypothetical protein
MASVTKAESGYSLPSGYGQGMVDNLDNDFLLSANRIGMNFW